MRCRPGDAPPLLTVMSDYSASAPPAVLSTGDRAAIRAAAAANGTPLFVYQRTSLIRQVRRLADGLPDGVGIIYSVKANPNPTIIGLLLDHCAGAEVAGVGELAAARAAGADPLRLAMVGPGKQEADHRAAIDNALGMIVVESAAEMARLQKVAAGRGPVSVALRVNPGRGSGGRLRMDGDTQFGMEPEVAVTIARDHERFPDLSISGVHGYGGSQQADPAAIVRCTEMVLDAAAYIQMETGLRLTWLDLGGGFAQRVREGDPSLDVACLKAPLTRCLDQYRAAHPWTERIMFESGRFLVAESGILVASVVDIKVNHGRTYVILDGGIAQFGFDDRTYGQRAPAVSLLNNRDEPAEEIRLCGPLCTPADRIAASVNLARPRVGDLLCIFNVGAYGLTGNPGLFLGQGFAPELLLEEAGATLIRRRFTAADYLRVTAPLPDSLR